MARHPSVEPPPVFLGSRRRRSLTLARGLIHAWGLLARCVAAWRGPPSTLAPRVSTGAFGSNGPMLPSRPAGTVDLSGRPGRSSRANHAPRARRLPGGGAYLACGWLPCLPPTRSALAGWVGAPCRRPFRESLTARRDERSLMATLAPLSKRCSGRRLTVDRGRLRGDSPGLLRPVPSIARMSAASRAAGRPPYRVFGARPLVLRALPACS